jgi:hypothetical protein
MSEGVEASLMGMRFMQLRLTDDEFTAMSAAAAVADMPVARWARTILLDAVNAGPETRRPGERAAAAIAAINLRLDEHERRLRLVEAREDETA